MARLYCRSCHHWIGTEDQLFGECTRFPTWMETEPKHYCGEYKGRPRGEKKQEKPKVNKETLNSVVYLYSRLFKEKYGRNPVISGVDWAAAKTMILDSSAEEAMEFVTEFIKHTPAWHEEKKVLDLKVIPGISNKLSAQMAGRKDMEGFLDSQIVVEHKNDWFDYVDNVKKTGVKKTYEEWKKETDE